MADWEISHGQPGDDEAQGFAPNGMAKGGFDAVEVCCEKAL